MPEACCDAARAAGLAQAGTATRARRWLLLEAPGRWGRDVVEDNDLPDGVAALLRDWLARTPDARALFVRRRGRRRARPLAFLAETTEAGGELRRLELESLDALGELDLARAGELVDEPLVLVCTHGRRDACCARRGLPVHDALARALPAHLLWQSSHHGGHRFAANVLVLPAGIQLGQVEPDEARVVAETLRAGRIPLHRYRACTLHPPHAQAADAAVRAARGLDRVGDVSVVSTADGVVRVRVPDGEVEVEVAELEGPLLPPSCGAAPEPTTLYAATLRRP